MIMKNQIALAKALPFIRSFNGRIFSVQFVKADGTVRKMVARMSVRKASGTGNYSHTKDMTRNNITVWDMTKGAYRAIPLDRVTRLTFAGQDYQIV